MRHGPNAHQKLLQIAGKPLMMVHFLWVLLFILLTIKIIYPYCCAVNVYGNVVKVLLYDMSQNWTLTKDNHKKMPSLTGFKKRKHSYFK